jgi:methyl-accepting chemotaxis protein
MQDQAQRLAEAVAIFKLGGETAAARPVLAKAVAQPAALPARKPAAKPAAKAAVAVVPPTAKKTTSAPAGDDWEEF